jgi:hypothetical protein
MQGKPAIRLDRSTHDDVYARVPGVAAPTDPLLHHLDPFLDDNELSQAVRAD